MLISEHASQRPAAAGARGQPPWPPAAARPAAADAAEQPAWQASHQTDHSKSESSLSVELFVSILCLPLLGAFPS